MSIWTLALIVLIIVMFGGGHFYNSGVYRTGGFGIGTILFIILVILLLRG